MSALSQKEKKQLYGSIKKLGLLAAEHDSHGLAKHILRYLQDEWFWQGCSNRAMNWMEERFDLVKQTQELEQIYFSLLKSASV